MNRQDPDRVAPLFHDATLALSHFLFVQYAEQFDDLRESRFRLEPSKFPNQLPKVGQRLQTARTSRQHFASAGFAQKSFQDRRSRPLVSLLMKLAQNAKGVVQARPGWNFVAIIKGNPLHSDPE